jgi:hypothetical protein
LPRGEFKMIIEKLCYLGSLEIIFTDNHLSHATHYDRISMASTDT